MSTIDQDMEVIDASLVGDNGTSMAMYDVTDLAIAELKRELSGLTEYNAVSKGIAKVRTLRTRIEATRKQLKADSLAWGRKVDSEAKRITEQLEAMEEPLKQLKAAIDAAKEAEKAAIAAAKAAETQKRLDMFAELEYPVNPFLVAEMSKEEYEAALGVASLAFRTVLEKRRQEAEAAEAAKREAEAAEVARAEAIRAEREALARERAELEAEKAKRDEADRLRREAVEEQERIGRIEQARIQAEAEAERQQAQAALQAERAALQAERDRLAQEAFEREEAIRIAKEREEAEKRAEAERIEAERIAAEAKAAKAARIEALKPDAEKFHAFAKQIRHLSPLIPDTTTERGQAFEFYCASVLENLAERCEGFGK
jgi:colicin import membrane protein